MVINQIFKTSIELRGGDGKFGEGKGGGFMSCVYLKNVIGGGRKLKWFGVGGAQCGRGVWNNMMTSITEESEIILSG